MKNYYLIETIFLALIFVAISGCTAVGMVSDNHKEIELKKLEMQKQNCVGNAVYKN